MCYLQLHIFHVKHFSCSWTLENVCFWSSLPNLCAYRKPQVSGELWTSLWLCENDRGVHTATLIPSWLNVDLHLEILILLQHLAVYTRYDFKFGYCSIDGNRLPFLPVQEQLNALWDWLENNYSWSDLIIPAEEIIRV